MPRSRLLTPRFLALCVGGIVYFVGVASPLTVLPSFLENTVGATDIEVGISIGIFGIAAGILRPIVGPLGDRRGRRLLVAGGASIAAIALVLTAAAHSVPSIIALRIFVGVGEAAVFVGLATAVQDLAPEDRRGEAASYFSTSIYAGLALGPPMGEWLTEQHGDNIVWYLAGAMTALAALLGFIAAPGPPAEPPPPSKRRLLHPAAFQPGLILFLGMIGYAGFLTFIALHADDVGIDNTGSVFAVFAVIVLTLRIVAAQVPDRLGPRRTSSIALTFGIVGLSTYFLWQAPAGVYVATAILAVGQTFFFPALFVLVVDEAPDHERSHAVGTFSMAFDLAFGLGGAFMGIVAELTDRPTAFLSAACISGVALIVANRTLSPRPDHVITVAGAPARARR